MVPSSNLGVATGSNVAHPMGAKMVQTARIVTPVHWIVAPEWLTVEQACDLSGHDRGTMLQMAKDRVVDVEREGSTWLIEKKSLWEYQETLALLLHWDD